MKTRSTCLKLTAMWPSKISKITFRDFGTHLNTQFVTTTPPIDGKVLFDYVDTWQSIRSRDLLQFRIIMLLLASPKEV